MLRSRPLQAVVGAEIVSGLGSYTSFLAVPWFVLVTTGSATRMGLVLAAELAPIAGLGISSGALVTRYGARTTMLVCDLARAPLIAAVPLLHEAGLLSFPLLLGLIAAVGAFTGPHVAAQRLVLPEIVGDDEGAVAKANALFEGGNRFNQLAGPALAGVLIALMGAANVLYLDAATFLGSFLVLAALVPRRPPVDARIADRFPALRLAAFAGLLAVLPRWLLPALVLIAAGMTAVSSYFVWIALRAPAPAAAVEGSA